MKYEAWTPPDFTEDDRRPLVRKSMVRTVTSSATLVTSIVLGAWIIYAQLDAPPSNTPHVSGPRHVAAAEPLPSPENYEAVLGVLVPVVAANPYGDLVNPSYSLGTNAVSIAENAPLRQNFQSNLSPVAVATLEADKVVPVPAPTNPQLLQNVPLPAPRPTDLQTSGGEPRLPGHPSVPSRTAAFVPPAPATSEGSSFFQKLFGMSPSSGRALAYAAPEDGALRSNPGVIASQPRPTNDHLTAVYDISKRTVYLPNGTKLEAHSGLGPMLDDPRYVNERMRGATPPHVYELTLREALFHGVQALRLNPVGEGTVYGRSGLLAHRYMLGPNGDSNGCVSIKDYEAFLQAFKNGEIRRLAVVARMN